VVMQTLLMMSFLAAAPKAETDLDKLQGEWKIVSAEGGAAEFLKDGIKAGTLRMTFKGDKVLVSTPDGGNQESGAVKLDPTGNPKKLTIGAGEQVFPGIYELNGDDLKICTSDKAGGNGPKEFSGKDGSDATLMVLKRVKK
jgi:uncharacterized protein (TIGR03067 family)